MMGSWMRAAVETVASMKGLRISGRVVLGSARCLQVAEENVAMVFILDQK